MTTDLHQPRTGAQGRALITLPGEGKVYQTLGIASTLKTHQDDTGQTCDVFEAVFPPQVGMPAHRHHRSAEAVYVLQGELVIRIDDQTVNAPAGSFGFIPREAVHAMHNAGSEPCKVLLWQMPGSNIERQFEAMDRLPPGPPDLSQLMPLFAEFDIEPVAPDS